MRLIALVGLRMENVKPIQALCIRTVQHPVDCVQEVIIANSYCQDKSHVSIKMTLFQICAKPLIAKTELAALTIYADAPLDSREKSVKQVKKKIAYPHND